MKVIETKKAPGAIGPYSQGFISGGFVFTSGQIPVDPETGATSHGIPGTGGAAVVSQERNGPYLSDECFKMALTDALSVSCKALGIAADVYWDKDRTKYTVDSGSKNAAEEAGKQKMEEYKAKDEELAKNPPPRAMATAEQKVFIQQNAPDDLCLKAMQEYGPNFETMGQGEAAKIINHIKRTSGAS